MKKPECWDEFLNDIADSFQLKSKFKEIFLVRFAHENRGKKEEDIWQDAGASSKDDFKKKMTQIYRQFATLPQGYQGLENFKQKFDALREWFQNEKYAEWIKTYHPSSSDLFSIERSIESDCYQQLLQPNSFVRIKAPQKMGKTLLLRRVLVNLKNKGHQTIRFDFGLEEQEMFANYARFCHGFCAGITEALDLPDNILDYWSDRLGTNQNTTRYFQQYLLPAIERPLVLGLDGLDCVFEQEQIATNFCKLLRGWHDNHREIWQKLRLIVAHSTDVYSGLAINSSPLAGIGQVMVLTPFTEEQVQTLAQRYQLNLEPNQTQELMALLGGHPYLIQQTFRYLSNSQIEISWQELLQLAPTDTSPLINHLRQLLGTLKQNPELATALAEIILATKPICLPSDIGFKLQGLGLVTVEGNLYAPRCDLYRQYFIAHLDELRQ